MPPPPEGFRLRAVEWPAPLDARRGVVRLSAQTMSLLGLRPWDPLRLEGRRLTGALVATAPPGTDSRVLLCDELTLRNLGRPDGGDVETRRATEQPTTTLVLSGPPELARSVPPEVLRLALLGKVVTPGDEVSLLPQDFVLPDGTDPAARDAARRHLATLTGADDWRTVLLLVSGAAPPEPSIVTMGTTVGWADGATTSGEAGSAILRALAPPPPVASAADGAAPATLPGLEDAATDLREWLDLGFNGHDLLRRLGTRPHLGVLVSGPAGCGKATLVESVAATLGASVRRVGGTRLAATEPADAARELTGAADDALANAPCVLLVSDVEALAPRDPTGAAPLAEVLYDTITRLVPTARVAVVCTTTDPEGVSRRLREPGLLEREIVIPLPSRDQRRRMLEALTHASPLVDVDLDEVAGRTPGFVLSDLVGLCREAAVRAAHRHRASPAASAEAAPTVSPADFDAALAVVRPTAMAGDALEVPDLRLDDVGDMSEVKAALTEAVIWPLTYPDTFDRLGVQAPRGVLLYGPPGCGKTFLVRALAGTGKANVLAVKGAELLTKWVGESERGVRELFRRARHAAPAIVFLDEVDALLPTRGASTDAGVTDRVVAAMLTELDGVEGLRDVCVVAATNRPDLVDPALLRPGRFDRLVYVGPPDAAARAEILAAASRRTPLADDVDLGALAAACEGFSAADCAGLVREAALVAMRESMDTPVVTAAHVAAARAVVRPSLRPEQLEDLERFAASRR